MQHPEPDLDSCPEPIENCHKTAQDKPFESGISDTSEIGSSDALGPAQRVGCDGPRTEMIAAFSLGGDGAAAVEFLKPLNSKYRAATCSRVLLTSARSLRYRVRPC